MKNLKKVLALVLVVAMMASFAVGASAAFPDQDEISADYALAVDVLTGMKVINGYPDGTFRPEGNVTRGAFAKMVAYVMTSGKEAASSYATSAALAFSDVEATATLAPSIGYAVSKGYVSGYPDGTFRAGNSVSGLAAAKILLGALGFDGVYTGTGWDVNVLNDGDTAGLFADMDSVDLAKPLTREAAAQMIWNAINYSAKGETVEYVVKNASDVVLYQGTDALTALALASVSGNTLSTATTTTDSLGNVKFGLTKDVTAVGEFGRPTTEYTNGQTSPTKKVVYASTSKAAAVYTTAVKGSQIYADLGLTSAPTSVYAYVNGASASVLGTYNGITATATNTVIGGNGIITEVYKTGTNDLTIVQIKYTLGSLNNVVNYAATAAKGAYTTYTVNNVTVNSNVYVDNTSSQIGTYNVFSTVVNKVNDVDTVVLHGAVAKGDYVLTVSDATTGLAHIYPVTSVEGLLTASNAISYTIGGTAYPVASVTVAGGSASFATTLYSKTTPVTVVLDSYGNVIAPVAGAVAAPNYVYVAFQEDAWSLAGTTLSASVTAHVVDTDGKISTMSVTNIGGSPVDGSTVKASTLTNGLYTYRLNADGSTYSFASACNAISGSFNYATSAVLTGSTYGNANTVFYTINCDPVTHKPVSVTTTVGMANMGNVTTATGAYIAANNVASHVFLTTATAGTTAKVVYYGGSFSFDGTNYIFDVLVNGAPDTVKNANANYLSIGLSSIAANGTVTAINTASGFSGHTGTYTATGKTYGLVNNGGLLSVVETVVATGVATTTANIDTIADTVPVYVISASAGTCTTGTAKDLAISGASLIYIQANGAGTAIGAIYAIVA